MAVGVRRSRGRAAWRWRALAPGIGSGADPDPAGGEVRRGSPPGGGGVDGFGGSVAPVSIQMGWGEEERGVGEWVKCGGYGLGFPGRGA